MIDLKREYKEAVAIARFEPGLKNIYVEGISDRYFINSFFSYHKIGDFSVFDIDQIDFTELYEKMEKKQASFYQNSNKQRVILLAQSIEKETNDNGSRTLCIIDVDWDYVLNTVYAGKYLCYTDYNSMEMYLFKNDTVRKYLQEGHRISNVKEDNLLESLSLICRQVFHVHCLLHERGKQMVNNNKSFSFEKSSQMCSINIDNYLEATLNKNSLMSEKDKIKGTFVERMKRPCADVREEIRGHDFVYYLYLCTKKLKTKMDMNCDEFANMFWHFADYDRMSNEKLFQKMLTL